MQPVVTGIADPGVLSLIVAWSHTFVEVDHEIFSMVILLPLIQEGLVSVTRRMVNHLVKLAQETVWLG